MVGYCLLESSDSDTGNEVDEPINEQTMIGLVVGNIGERDDTEIRGIVRGGQEALYKKSFEFVNALPQYVIGLQ
jgi:hypothetical protein